MKAQKHDNNFSGNHENQKKGRYDKEGNYVDENGNQICEWCESRNIADTVPETTNGICNDCGSHW